MKTNLHRHIVLLIFLILTGTNVRATDWAGPEDGTAFIFDEIFGLEEYEKEVVIPFKRDYVPQEKTIARFPSYAFDLVEGEDDMSDLKENSMLAEEINIVQQARAVLAEVKAAAQFIQQFNGEDLVSLPQAIKQEIGETTVIIVANKIRLYPQYAQLEVFLEVDRPDFETPLIFYSPDVKFTRTGGLAGVSSVGLLGNMVVDLEDKKSAIVFNRGIYQEGEGFTGGTYVQFGCDGFVEMGIDAGVHFSREWLLPVSPAGHISTTPKDRVVGRFQTKVADINDMLFEVDMDDFVVTKNQKIIWTIENAVFDFSESNNSTSFSFPIAEGNYNPTTEGLLATPEEWKGIYIGEFGITWRDTIVKGGNNKKLGIAGYDLVIDHNGFTGLVEVTNLVTIDEGDVDGWAMSIDRLAVQIIKNSPSALEFEGLVAVPLLNGQEDGSVQKTETLEYTGDFDFVENEYALGVSLTEDKEFPIKMLRAKVTIANTSSLDFLYAQGDGLEVSATLYGDFTIDNADVGNNKLNIPEIGFEHLSVASRRPFIRDVGSWELPDSLGARFKGFGLSVKGLELADNEDRPELRFITNINLAAKDAIYISATGALRLVGQIDEGGEQQNWKYDRLKIDMLEVEFDSKAFAFYGQIIFFDDDIAPDYGSGFQGKVNLWIRSLNKGGGEGGMGIGAMAIFGSKEGTNGEEFRYFLVDALAKFSPGIPMSAISLYGLGGGVYYHMQQGELSTDISEDEGLDIGTGLSESAYAAALAPYIGRSLSGTKYLPSQNVLVGVNATVVIATSGKEEAFNANINFNIQINSNGGVDHIKLNGFANIMAPISWSGPACSGVSVGIAMQYIFNSANSPGNQAEGFYASADIFVNLGLVKGNATDVPAGFAQGSSAGCDVASIYAGGLEMEITTDRWFINLGTPSHKVSLKADLKVARVNVGAYMDIGQNIPPFPGLPPQVADLTGFRSISQSTRSNGEGFAFGAAFDVDLLDINWFVFSANLSLGAGFDIMLKKFKDYTCVNLNNEPIGINNWYALGQAWAYVTGDIRGFGFSLISLGLSAAIQVKAPNPTFGRGAVGGRYSVLFGTISGTCNFQFQFGEICDPGDGTILVSDMDFIKFLTPEDEETNVSTISKVTASFFYPVNEIVSFPSNDDPTVSENFRLTLDYFTLKDEEGNMVPGVIDQRGSYHCDIVTDNLLSANTTYTIDISVTLYDLNNNKALDDHVMSQTFTTGDKEETIPEFNVANAYPGNGQFNYYRNAPGNPANFIQLERGQDEIFEIPDTIEQKLKFTSNNPPEVFYTSFTYDKNLNRINYSLPLNIKRGKSYRLQVVNKSKTDPGVGSPGLGNDMAGKQPDMENKGQENKISSVGEGLLDLEDDEFEIYALYFRVSNYNNPQSKWESIELGNIEKVSTLEDFITISGLSEPFGYEEIKGLYGENSAISIWGDLENTEWMDSYYNFESIDLGTLNMYADHCGSPSIENCLVESFPEHRIAKYGEREPFNAISIVQENWKKCIITAENIVEYNNMEDINALSPNIFLDYKIDNQVKADIEGLFNGIYFSLYYGSDIEAINHEDLPEFDDCVIPYASRCCEDDPNMYNAMLNLYKDQLKVMPLIFKIFHEIETDRQIFCYQDRYRNTFEYVPLTSGTYPLKFIYKTPFSEVTSESQNYQVIKL